MRIAIDNPDVTGVSGGTRVPSIEGTAVFDVPDDIGEHLLARAWMGWRWTRPEDTPDPATQDETPADPSTPYVPAPVESPDIPLATRMRTWAIEQGLIPESRTGRLPKAVIAAYNEAHQ